MHTKYLSAQHTGTVSAGTISQRPLGLERVYTTLKLLESNVSACEVLADELGPHSYTHPLHEHINECIVSCEQMIGAMVRQSRFAIQYAEVCVAACANLANACVFAEARTALHCAQLCSDCIDLIREDFETTLSN